MTFIGFFTLTPSAHKYSYCKQHAVSSVKIGQVPAFMQHIIARLCKDGSGRACGNVSHLRAGRHCRARGVGANVHKGEIQHADSIVHVHGVHCEPFSHVFTRWKLHSFIDVALAKCHIDMPLQFQALQHAMELPSHLFQILMCIHYVDAAGSCKPAHRRTEQATASQVHLELTSAAHHSLTEQRIQRHGTV